MTKYKKLSTGEEVEVEEFVDLKTLPLPQGTEPYTLSEYSPLYACVCCGKSYTKHAVLKKHLHVLICPSSLVVTKPPGQRLVFRPLVFERNYEEVIEE